MLREHLGIELLQLVEQDFILAADVIGVAGHHEEQQRVALDVTKETQTEAASLAGTLDDAGDVGHHERLIVAIGHDAQRGFHRCERIVGNLRAGIRQCTHQRRLAGIGESHEADIGQQLQLEDDGHLLHGLAGLCEAWCLIGGRAELEVAESTATTLEQDDFLSVVVHVAHKLTCLGIVDHRTRRHIDVDIAAIGAVTLVGTAVATVFSEDVSLIAQVQQGPIVVVAAQDDITTPAAVTAVGTAVVVVLQMLQMHRAATALS